MESKLFRNKTTRISLICSMILYYGVGSIIPLLGLAYLDLKMEIRDYSDYAQSTANKEPLLTAIFLTLSMLLIAVIWCIVEGIKAKKYENFAFVLKEGELYFYDFIFDHQNPVIVPIENAGIISTGVNLYNLYATASYINKGIKNEKQIADLTMKTSQILKINEITKFEDNKKIINFTANCHVLTRKGFTKAVVKDFEVSKNFNDYNELKKIISERSYVNV